MKQWKYPCNLCREPNCKELDCPQWQLWFLEQWEAFHKAAWDREDRQGRQTPRGFCYELPHRIQSPCCECICRSWCQVPCSKRLQWWDRRIHAQG